MQIEKVSVEQLRAAAYNPRKTLKPGDPEYEKLKRSISEFGYVEPVIWNKRTGNVVGGHQRLTVMKDLGATEVDCVVVDLDDQREKALNIALNKIQGDWDKEKLASLLTEFDGSEFNVTLTGFDATEVEALLNAFYSKEAVQDDFDVEQEHKEISSKGAITQPGDIWKLGVHRLMCGDATSEQDMAKLMNGNKAQMAVTSPPNGGGKDYEKNGLEPWLAAMRSAVKNLTRYAGIVCWNLCDLYPTGTQFIEPTNFFSSQMFAEHGFRPIWIRIWKKQGANFGISSYHTVSNKPTQQYEYISAFSRNGDVEYNDQEYVWLSAYAGHAFRFVKRLTKEERKNWGYAGIWEMSGVRSGKDQPAMYPVELPWRCMKMHSDRGDIVLEPFSGSGTTIIASEQLERVCYAMEKDPAYCDLAVKRWEQFTGQKAERVKQDVE